MILNLAQLREDYKSVYKVNWKLARKLEILIEVTKVELAHQDAKSQKAKKLILSEFFNSLGISLRSIQRWKNDYTNRSLYGLAPKARGHRKRTHLSQKIKDRIEYYRKQFRWGSEVIQAHLLHDDKIIINRYKIERYLKESGLREKYPCSTAKKQKAQKRKHTKKVVVYNPGEHTQLDVKYQLHLLENKQKAYVYNFVDHASNWSFKKTYKAINVANTENFMEELLKVCPFAIKRLQTDNGIEFTFKWTSKHPDDPKEHPLLKICAREGITHKLIPPGEKELQGLVERSHRQDDQELFSRISPKDLNEFNQLLEGYYKFRNRGRRFKKLGWLSPDTWLENYLVRTYAILMHIKGKNETVDKLVA